MMKEQSEALDWDRWHDLLELRDQRRLTLVEQIEYNEFAELVARLDAEDEAICAPGIAALTEQHGQVLESIRRRSRLSRFTFAE